VKKFNSFKKTSICLLYEIRDMQLSPCAT